MPVDNAPDSTPSRRDEEPKSPGTAAGGSVPGERGESPAAASHRLLREAQTGALATLDSDSGHPYASLVTVATEPDGSPLMLLSGLARHTQNLRRDHRVSLLVDGTAGHADPLAGGRVTIVGTIAQSTGTTFRRRFLARHPEASGYAGFADFAFYTLTPERAHFIGGFGRIVAMPWSEVRVEASRSASLIHNEPDILAALQQDYPQLAQRLANGARTAPAKLAEWKLVGLDPAGLDLVGGGKSLRINFPRSVQSQADVREFIGKLLSEPRAEGTT
jgi:putative heme iron utilization protein